MAVYVRTAAMRRKMSISQKARWAKLKKRDSTLATAAVVAAAPDISKVLDAIRIATVDEPVTATATATPPPHRGLLHRLEADRKEAEARRPRTTARRFILTMDQSEVADGTFYTDGQFVLHWRAPVFAGTTNVASLERIGASVSVKWVDP